jgi:hypothetical protein
MRRTLQRHLHFRLRYHIRTTGRSHQGTKLPINRLRRRGPEAGAARSRHLHQSDWASRDRRRHGLSQRLEDELPALAAHRPHRGRPHYMSAFFVRASELRAQGPGHNLAAELRAKDQRLGSSCTDSPYLQRAIPSVL